MYLKKPFRLMIGFVFLIFLAVPLGLFSKYPAWGEWDKNYFEKIVGFVPKGIEESTEITTPFLEYRLENFDEITSYYLSAGIGVLVIFLTFFLIKVVWKNER